MKIKPQTFLIGFLLLTALCFSQRVAAQTLVLHHADGTTTDVELYTQPRIEFQNDRVLITSPVLSMDYAKADVLRFTYKGSIITAVSQPRDGANFSHEQGQLVFHGIKQSDKVAVYTANGIRVPVTITHRGTDASLPLSQIPQGVYLLSINGRTSKFTKP